MPGFWYPESQLSLIFFNQARAGHRSARAWFLKITSVRMYDCVRVCVCVRPRGHE